MYSHIQLNEQGEFLRFIPAGENIKWDANNYCSAFALEKDNKANQFNVVPFFTSTPPLFDPVTQVVREIAPVLSAKGHWGQQWEVVPRFADQADADAAVAASLVERLNLTRQKSLSDLAYQYDARAQSLAAGYSQYERESWPVQTAEAADYFADNQAPTPWLNAASTSRGIEKAELAARVLAMDTAYRQIHGALTGHRQKLWDQIAAAQTAEDIAAIDVTAGWPA